MSEKYQGRGLNSGRVTRVPVRVERIKDGRIKEQGGTWTVLSFLAWTAV